MKYQIRTSHEDSGYEYKMRYPFQFKGVNFDTGETFTIEAINDLEHQSISFNCRKCHRKYTWTQSTEDQWGSGLCESCLIKENNSSEIIYIMQRSIIFDDMRRPIRPPRDREWEVRFRDGEKLECSKEEVIPYFCRMPDEIRESHLYLKYEIENPWTLINFNQNHIQDFEIEFAENNSEFVKMIWNRTIEAQISKMIRYETWKQNNFEILLKLLFEWSEMSSSEIIRNLYEKFPDSTSPGGASWNRRNLRFLREYLDLEPKEVLKEWEKFESYFISLLWLKNVLIPRRYIIFKSSEKNQFSFKQIDALIKLEESYFIIDIKYLGSDVNTEQGELYRECLELIGYDIEAVIFVTAEEGMVKKLSDDIYAFPEIPFRVALEGENEAKILHRIKKLIDFIDNNKYGTLSR